MYKEQLLNQDNPYGRQSATVCDSAKMTSIKHYKFIVLLAHGGVPMLFCCWTRWVNWINTWLHLGRDYHHLASFYVFKKWKHVSVLLCYSILQKGIAIPFYQIGLRSQFGSTCSGSPFLRSSPRKKCVCMFLSLNMQCYSPSCMRHRWSC